MQKALRSDGQTAEADQIKLKLQQVLIERERISQNQLEAVRINNEGSQLEKDGNLAGALERYRRALELDPEHVGIRVNYAVALLRLGQWKPGLAELREALRRDPGNAQIRAALEDALSQAPPEFRAEPKDGSPR